MTDGTQRLLHFLGEATSYLHHPAEVRLVQTHASWVFLAPPFVYKVKKPVNFGFLDFSTLELRHADCEREVTLNRRLAEDIYLGLETIRESDDGLHFGGEGTVVEWVVKMRELAPRYFMKELLKQQAVGLGDIDRVVERLGQFYTAQPPLPGPEVASAVDRLRQDTEDNFVTAQRFTGQTLTPVALAAMARYTHEFFDQQARLLASRIEQGRIRDCHGDLHLEHIHLAPDAVRIYDCIEFNTDFRHIDVACDLAFLAMDLDFNGRADLTRHLVKRSVRRLQDPGMEPLMDFYKCYRACVRGKVESLHSVAESMDEAGRREAVHLAQRYHRLALRYAIAGSGPRAFVFMGRVASGKSALAAALGRETGWPVISSDPVRKTLAQVPLDHRGTPEQRAALYAPGMTERTYARLFELAQEALCRGDCVIIDATFSLRAQRAVLKQQLAAEHCSPIWIETCATEEVMRHRLRGRERADAVVSDARLEDYHQLNARYEVPDELSPGEKVTIETDGLLDDALHLLTQDLAVRRASIKAPDESGEQE